MEKYQFFSIVIIVIGTLMVFYQLYLLSKIKKSNNWKTIKGEIISSKINTLSFTGGDKTYKADINYKYAIEGKEYFSNRVFFGDKIRSDSTTKSNMLIRKYLEGCKIDVYYNPDNLGDSVLERRTSPYIIVLLIVGIFTAIIGLAILYYHPFIKTLFAVN